MSERKKALAELLARVAAGDAFVQPWYFQDVFNDAGHKNCAGEAFGAYNDKSVDNALYVLGVVMPGADVDICIRLVLSDVTIYAGEDTKDWHSCSDESPARALLIATLKVLIAGEA